MSEHLDKQTPADPPRSVAEQRAAMAPGDKADITGDNYPGDSPVDSNRLHKVVEGESLRDIAGTFYGSPEHWERILAANRGLLTDPTLLTPGQMLIIPPDTAAGGNS